MGKRGECWVGGGRGEMLVADAGMTERGFGAGLRLASAGSRLASAGPVLCSARGCGWRTLAGRC